MPKFGVDALGLLGFGGGDFGWVRAFAGGGGSGWGLRRGVREGEAGVGGFRAFSVLSLMCSSYMYINKVCFVLCFFCFGC